MIRFIATIISFLLTASFIFPQEPDIFRDDLVYSYPEEVWKSWTPAMGEEAKEILAPEISGIRILDFSGDAYEAWNNQKALFLRNPMRKPPYFFQATIDELNPPERYGQAGLVAWKDADNYVRTTIGFNPAGMECLGEFDGKPHSRGVPGFYPVKNPHKNIVRMEVLERSVRGYVSHDGATWLGAGGVTLPGKNKSEKYFSGIGILGVAGGKTGTPVFSDWTEGAIPSYQDDEFDGETLGDHWMIGHTNGGWGKDKTRMYLKDGSLFIHPFPGSDIFLGNENYPYVSQCAPDSEAWTLEIRVGEFRGKSFGRWNKVGVVFWQDSGHFINLSLVADEDDDHMYFEAVSQGERNPRSVLKSDGFRPRENADLTFRFSRKDRTHYEGFAFIGDDSPTHLGTFENPLYEPQIRLFASGDVFIQYPNDHDYYAAFDYIRIVEK